MVRKVGKVGKVGRVRRLGWPNGKPGQLPLGWRPGTTIENVVLAGCHGIDDRPPLRNAR